MEKALSWPVVKPEDVKSLQVYALFLRECCNAMEDVQYMRELDMPANMRKVILKLPYKLREKWRVSACEILERFNRRARFIDIVTFIEYQVKIVSDPIFGDIQNTQLTTVSKNGNRTKSQSKPRFKGDSFATTVTTIETPASEDPESLTRFNGKVVNLQRTPAFVCVALKVTHWSSVQDWRRKRRGKR